MLKILVVDDEERLRKIIGDFLAAKGYLVVEAADGEEAIDVFTSEKNVDLVTLDVMMPKLDGWEVLKEIRRLSSVPVLMLTARGEESDELTGFKLGADEYISKPFSPKVLVARIEALLKRNFTVQSGERTFGKLSINEEAHTVKVGSTSVDLSFKEFELLKFFAENEGIALSRDRILNNVWDFDYFGDERTVDTHVKKLRSKLGECCDYIKTIRGLGYKFEANE